MRTVNLNVCGEAIVLQLDDKGGGDVVSTLHDYSEDNRMELSGAFHAMESIVLAHACAGVDVESEEYLEGLCSAFDAICNNL